MSEPTHPSATPDARSAFWISLASDAVSIAVSVALMHTYIACYDLKANPPKRLEGHTRALERLSRAAQVACLTILWTVAFYRHGVSVVTRAVTWLAMRLAPRYVASRQWEAARVTDRSADEASEMEVVAGAPATAVSCGAEPHARTAPRPRQQHWCRRRWPDAVHIAQRVVSHPLTALCVFSYAVFGIYNQAHKLYPGWWLQKSQEAHVRLFTNGLTGIVLLVCLSVVALKTVSRAGRAGVLPRRRVNLTYVVVSLVIFYAAYHTTLRTLWNYFFFNTFKHMSVRILGDDEDFCAGVGQHTRKALRSATVWPVATPRWAWGSALDRDCKAGRKSIPPLAYMDRDSDTLLISPQCWHAKTKPRVFLERPKRYPSNPAPNLAPGYYAYVEAKYGTDEKARQAHVVVHRDGKSGRVSEVELQPEWLTPVVRPAARRGSPEALVRAHWRSRDRVIAVPLGASSSYVVRCPDVRPTYAETYMYPLNHSERGVSGVGASSPAPPPAPSPSPSPRPPQEQAVIGVDEPPGNVFVILEDAVSRQDVVRSLPEFSKWLRDFRARQPSGGFMVEEPLHHSTLGLNSAENLGPMICGAEEQLLVATFGENRTATRPQAPNETIFFEFKARYGESVETTLTSTACTDIVGPDCDTPPLPGSGHAVAMGGIDRHLYYPFCDKEYSGSEYVTKRRCMNGKDPHVYTLDYVSDLFRLRKRAARSDASDQRPRFFLDWAYFLEGHESSHAVLGQSDAALTAFMRHLENDLGFFKNPLNTLVFGGDHGNHMGHYMETSLAGQLERTTPAMIFIFHPEMTRRVDRMKNRPDGTSLANFRARLRGFNSQMDLHMTLRDILGIHDVGLRLYDDKPVRPTSYFDARNVTPTACRDFRGSENGKWTCALDYCEP